MSPSTIPNAAALLLPRAAYSRAVLPAALADSPPAANSQRERGSAWPSLSEEPRHGRRAAVALTRFRNRGSKLPPDWQTRDVWFYESIKTGKMKPETGPDAAGMKTIHIDMQQEILLVFFAGDRFDGYMWYTNVGAAQGRVPQ